MHIEPETNMRTLAAALGAALLLALAPAARAQEAPWPAKPIRILVTGGPGSVTDVRARWLAPKLAAELAQAVVVENRPGAGGNLGMEFAARSAPDGYTLVMIHQGTMAVNPHLFARPGYDPLKDFAPVAGLGHGTLVLAVAAAAPYVSVAQVVGAAKAKPGNLTYGSPGVGTPPHMASELFKRLAGIEATHVPYKGGGAALSDLLGGHVTWTIEGAAVQLPQVKAGRLRALAVTGPRRVAALPDVPTMAEAGVAGYEYRGWTGVAAPAGTPPAIVARLHEAIARLLGSAEGREWLAANAFEGPFESPAELAAFIRAEHAKWGAIIRENGIRLE